MEPFLRRLSFLLVLLTLAGCGRGRTHPPPGKPYAVTMVEGIHLLSAASSAARAGERGNSLRGCSGRNVCSGSGNWDCGSGKDALVGIAALLVVVVVAAVVASVVDSATSGPAGSIDRYHLTLSGEGVPLVVLVITGTDHLYLEAQHHDALVRGAYTRAVLRPTAWEGTGGAPTQEVTVTLERGHIRIAPVAPPLQ
jgi:hypothetical protein